MAVGGPKNGLKPGLRGFGVPALAGGAVAPSSALKFFDVILFASAPPPEGGTPNLPPPAEPRPSGWTADYRVLQAVESQNENSWRGRHTN